MTQAAAGLPGVRPGGGRGVDAAGAGGTVGVQVPATSANIGPGYDCLGLALQLCDTLRARFSEGPTRITVRGQGAERVPRDERHLVLRALRRGLAAQGLDEDAPIDLSCDNVIPHGRGLGSSAAAIVGGLALADALGGGGLGRAGVYSLATEMEGHPDNVAPAVWGGFTIAWMTGDRDEGAADAVAGDVLDPRTAPAAGYARIDPPASLALSVCIPAAKLATSRARALLPTQVAHAAAAFNVARAAALVAAMCTGRGDLLAATADRLHQDYRAQAMPGTAALIERLRGEGLPAVVSGAGPTVLVLDRVRAATAQRLRAEGWDVRHLEPRPVGYAPVALGDGA